MSCCAAAGATERLMELLAARSPIADPPRPRELPAGRGTQPLRVEFVGVSFRYPSRPAVPVLQDLDLVIEPGQTVALVGPSGAGKTTVFLLLQRFYDIDAGQLTLDRVSARDLRLRRPARVHRHHAPRAGRFSPGRSSLFIRYGRLNASDEQAYAAAREPTSRKFRPRRLPAATRAPSAGAACAFPAGSAPSIRDRARHPQGRAAAAARRSYQQSGCGE